MLMPVCYLNIAMHSLARKELEQYYEITQDEARLSEASAAIVYGVPEKWAYSEDTNGLTTIACHSCEGKARQWVNEKGIKLTLAQSLWRTVAEHTLALMMAAARNLLPADRAIREGRWNNHHDLKVQYAGRDLWNKTVGIWGMGKIGTELVGLLSGFGMQILYHDLVRLPKEQESKMGIEYCALEDMLKRSDYFCVLIPLNADTKGALGKEQFAAMNKGCVLVNTARAGIIDEQAFRESLDNDTIGAAGLDVSGKKKTGSLLIWSTERMLCLRRIWEVQPTSAISLLFMR